MNRASKLLVCVVATCAITTAQTANHHRHAVRHTSHPANRKANRTAHRATHRTAHRASAGAAVSADAAVPVLDTARLASMPEHERLLTQEINKWSNVRYRHGGTSPKGVDCSGFIYKVFEHAAALNLPRSSREQAHVGQEVNREDLRFGDLLFFYSKKKSKQHRINHVAMYTADGYFVHSHRHGGVGIDSLDESYYAEHFALARRILPQNPASPADETVPSRAEF
jgi:cell wall-associated NlpC family hydrolase